ncbi:MAG: sulfur carrier protein ThiS [Myxococcaceae bacterium]
MNGQSRELPQKANQEATIDALLVSMGVSAGPVAVEVNGTVVRKAQHAAHVLRDGDQIEVVTFVGGG